MLKSRYHNHFTFLALSAVLALILLTVQSTAAMPQMDQRNVAVGPDGTTYVVGQRMEMGGMDDRGMDLTLYALSQENRLLWSYRLDNGEATAPVVGTNGTVYQTIRLARGGHM
jgi:hypothetical protein